MKPNLESAQEVLRSFLSEIAEVEKIRQGISAPILTPFCVKDRTPDFSGIEFVQAPDSFWREDNAYIWIYAEVWDYHSLMLHPKSNKMPDYYLLHALPIYQEWLYKEKEVTYRGIIIPSPGDLNLGDYLTELASYIQDGNEKRAVWIKSLKSFLQYIREDIPLELQGSLECIFPYKMEIRKGEKMQETEEGFKNIKCNYILRNIDEEVYPIDILAAADILKHLTSTVLEGRPNAQHTAAEALGFAWLCHAVGSARLMTQEYIVYTTSIKALKIIDTEESSRQQPKHFITIKTFHGEKEIPISKTLYEFLIALPRANGNISIFSRPFSSLLRTLYAKGVNQSKLASVLGKITFRTFMSQSTHWYGHRPGQGKIKQSRPH